MKSDGSPWRPLVHVRDISSAFLAALESPVERIDRQVINVGRQEDNRRIREIAEIVKGVMPGTVLEFAGDASPDRRTYRVDFTKAGRILPGWKPEWTIRLGAEELSAAYRRVGLTLEEFEGPRYNRIDHVKMLLDEGVLDDTLRWTRNGNPR